MTEWERGALVEEGRRLVDELFAMRSPVHLAFVPLDRVNRTGLYAMEPRFAMLSVLDPTGRFRLGYGFQAAFESPDLAFNQFARESHSLERLPCVLAYALAHGMDVALVRPGEACRSILRAPGYGDQGMEDGY